MIFVPPTGAVYQPEKVNPAFDWTIQRPAVKFAANGGRVYENGLKTSSTTVNYTWGQKYGSFPKAERTGYTFEGWYTSSTGSTRITEDMICEAADTLYAHWKGIPQKVSFDINTGYFNMGEITGGVRGKFNGRALNRPVCVQGMIGRCRHDRVFSMGEITGGRVAGGTADASRGPSGVQITAVYGQEYGTLPTVVYDGYTLDGWYTAPIGGEKITASTKAKLLAPQTLYAHWSAASYTVTLDGNGGTSVVVSADGTSKTVSSRTQKAMYGGTYAGDDGMFPSFTRTGYDFAGFYTEAEGGTQITIGTEFTANKLFAPSGGSPVRVKADRIFLRRPARVQPVVGGFLNLAVL